MEVSFAGKKVAVESGAFTPDKKGVYAVKYILRDYLGNTVVYQYDLETVYSDVPNLYEPNIPSHLTYGEDALLFAVKADLFTPWWQEMSTYRTITVYQADGVTVVDHLDEVSRGTFVSVLTNELPVFRRAYAASVPPALDGATNRTAVVRVFATREDYLAYVGAQHVWTAAIWDTLHRELVLWLPPDGTRELLRTVWHEAFHQYLAYAAALVPAVPWFNEGHAELFQHAQVTADGTLAFELDPEGAEAARAVARSATAETVLAALMEMDYPEFYAEGRERAAFHYRLAWSMAYFLEVGAPQMRFRPFETVRAEYAAALVSTREMRQANRHVWTAQRRETFISAWRDFWKRR
jgi:hypothetical protein